MSQYAPSDLIEVIPILSPVSQTAGTLTAASRVDISDFEHVLLVCSMGVSTTTDFVITPSHFAAASGGTGTALTAVSILNSEDDETHTAEYRCHGIGQFLEVVSVATGGSGGIIAITLIGFRRQASANLAGLVDTAEVGMA